MLLNKFAVLGLAVLAACSVGVARAQARNLVHAGPNHCTIGAPSVAKPSFSVTVKVACYKAGRPVSRIVYHKYTQLDYAGYSCGTYSNKGPGFTPRVKNTYYLRMTFTVKLASWVKGVPAPAPKSFTVVQGHQQTQCPGAYVGVPGVKPAPICDAAAMSFVNQYDSALMANQQCGVAKLDDETYTGVLPPFAAGPVVIGNIVYTPPLNTSCYELDQGATRFGWMTFPIRHAIWRCAKLGIEPELSVYYMPPDSSTMCHDGVWKPSYGIQYTDGVYNLPYSGVYTHFQLPDDWQSWGGTLVMVFRTNIFQWPGLNNHFDGHEFSVTKLNLQGSANACGELTTFKYR